MTDIAEIMGGGIWSEMTKEPEPDESAQAIRYAQAALTALQEHGFVVVPVVPNLAMRKVCTFKEAEITWPAMLAASPGSSGKKKVRTVGEPGENMGIGYPKKD